MTEIKRYYGKHRGVVVANEDPMREGRLLVQVGDVGGVIPATWATPCFPATGIQMGVYMLPQIGAGVWVEFEQGDPDKPIWSGCWYHNGGEIPALAQVPPPPGGSNFVIQTAGQNTLMLSDVPGPTGGILLKSTSGALISINEVGITISNGQGATIMMNGPTVTVNQGALVVT
tara:strand:+ start:339 stop:857 length:519 start_codon:yes stop_codon:yes gene_type:complete